MILENKSVIIFREQTTKTGLEKEFCRNKRVILSIEDIIYYRKFICDYIKQ